MIKLRKKVKIPTNYFYYFKKNSRFFKVFFNFHHFSRFFQGFLLLFGHFQGFQGFQGHGGNPEHITLGCYRQKHWATTKKGY